MPVLDQIVLIVGVAIFGGVIVAMGWKDRPKR